MKEEKNDEIKMLDCVMAISDLKKNVKKGEVGAVVDIFGDRFLIDFSNDPSKLIDVAIDEIKKI